MKSFTTSFLYSASGPDAGGDLTINAGEGFCGKIYLNKDDLIELLGMFEIEPAEQKAYVNSLIKDARRLHGVNPSWNVENWFEETKKVLVPPLLEGISFETFYGHVLMETEF